jgi:phytoene dehydrogenase-like protein
LILEQHDKPGGCATTFKRGDFTLEVGLHEMDGPSPGDIKSRIFNELEVSQNIEFVRVPEFYHFISDHHKLTVPHDPEQAKKILAMEFPAEIGGITAFYDQILNPRKKAADAGPQREKSLGEFLDSIIHDEDLKLVLLGNLGYFHDDPYSISLTYYSKAQGSYFKGGASYIKGGSQKLSDHLAEYIRNHNGDVLLNHPVIGIVSEGTRLTGVTYKKKTGSSTVFSTAYADEIIANTAIPNLTELLDGESGGKIKEEIRNQKPGASLLTIYFGFKNPLKTIGNHHYSTFVFGSSIKTQNDILKNNNADYHSRSFTFVDYGQIDSGLAPEGKSVGAICCIDYLKDWEFLSREEYNKKKEETAKIFIQRLENLIPGIAFDIEYYEVGTPATIKRYTFNPGGAVYGFAQVPGKPAINLNRIFDNLHIASAWGNTGGGFTGAIFGGYLCAVGILRRK